MSRQPSTEAIQMLTFLATVPGADVWTSPAARVGRELASLGLARIVKPKASPPGEQQQPYFGIKISKPGRCLLSNATDQGRRSWVSPVKTAVAYATKGASEIGFRDLRQIVGCLLTPDVPAGAALVMALRQQGWVRDGEISFGHSEVQTRWVRRHQA